MKRKNLILMFPVFAAFLFLRTDFKMKIKINIAIAVIFFMINSVSMASGPPQLFRDFCQGKWGGTITGILRSTYPGPPFDEIHDYPFTIRLRGHPGKAGSAVMKISASGPGSFTFLDSNAKCGFTYYRGTFSIMSNVLNEEMGTSLKGITVMTFVSFLTAGMSAELENENTIKLEFITEDDDFFASGTLYRVNLERETIGETIKINELVKTDNNTQKEIIIPDVGEVTLDRNTEIKIEDETSIEQFNGELRSKVKELHPDALKIRMPESVTSHRGTEFITKVEDGGENVLIVLKGEVEFSDIEKKKTVIVKENQMSVVKPGELPTDPLRIDPETILRWWE